MPPSILNIMAKRKKKIYLRVVPHGNVWHLLIGRGIKPKAVRNTKKEAIDAAKSIATAKTIIYIYRKNGKLHENIVPDALKYDGCFVTTACCKYHGLPDNCYELQTLRRFRDTYLINNKDGRRLVRQYYAFAPAIVELINNNVDAKLIYKDMFESINICCRYIDSLQFEEAKRIYINSTEAIACRIGFDIHKR